MSISPFISSDVTPCLSGGDALRLKSQISPRRLPMFTDHFSSNSSDAHDYYTRPREMARQHACMSPPGLSKMFLSPWI
jgi:hypothetical protein